MLRLSSKPLVDYNDTIWMPFGTDEAHDSDAFRAGDSMRAAVEHADAPVPDAVVALAERQWTRELAEAGLKLSSAPEGVEGGEAGESVELADGWEWARGKTVLLVGSSRESDGPSRYTEGSF